MADISFNIARKELKIAQIAQLYQLFRLLHLIHIYGHGFYELSRMVMRKNVNSDVSKDSPIETVWSFECEMWLLYRSFFAYVPASVESAKIGNSIGNDCI